VPLLCVSILLSWLSVLAFDYIGWHWNKAEWMFRWQYMVSDSHKCLAFAVAVATFLVFKNWRLSQSRLINAVASTTFGVLLIHAASDGMRKWLWQDFVNVPAAYSMPFLQLVSYSVFVMFSVFIVCSVLDYLRIQFIERPVFSCLHGRAIA